MGSELDLIIERIKTRRRQLGLSYQDLADLTHMSKSTLQRYETGAIRNLPLDRLEKLAEALQTSPEWLLGWDEDPFPIDKTDANFCEIPAFILKACNGDVLRSRRMMTGMVGMAKSGSISTDKCFYKLISELEPFEITNADVDFLVAVFKAYREAKGISSTSSLD